VTFPEEMTKQPTLWQIARDFDVTVNVAEGLVTDKSGWLVLDIEGDREEVRRVLVYLKQKGAKLAIPKVATRT
jgi:ABC-type methionine transport system ATPase subunit